MDLSLRLKTVVDMVNPSQAVADVGCDHAYISIYLIKNKISNKVIAMDVNEGPLDIGKRNISIAGFEDKIETRLSDGLEKLLPDEVDTIIIAGMGGSLTCKILQEGACKLHSIKELILQPQSEIASVRKLISKLGFSIVKEKMIVDDGKYYVVIRAVNSIYEDVSVENKTRLNKIEDEIIIENVSLDLEKEETHFLYGKYLLEDQNPVLYQYILRQKAVAEKIKHKLENTHTINASKRLKGIKKELEYIKLALTYY